jgi:hypothetical protein
LNLLREILKKLKWVVYCEEFESLQDLWCLITAQGEG